jgi:RNA recognition motif-containing protein
MIRNLDIDANIEELEQMFSKFGLINKVTLICDKYTGKSKGYLIKK